MPIGIAGVTAAAAIYAANKNSSATETAARLTTDSAKYGADAQTAANEKAVAFQRQQAEADYRNQELTRAANDRQARARYAGAQTLGQSIGFQLPGMPDYVPSVDPHYDTGQTNLPSTQTTPGSTTTTPGSGNPTDPGFIQTQLQNVYKALGATPTGRGTGPTDIAYMADQVAKTGGWTPQNAAYWGGAGGRIAQEIAKAKSGGGGAPNPTATTTPYGTNTIGAGLMMPDGGQAPQLQAPQLAPNPFYQPGTAGFALGRR